MKIALKHPLKQIVKILIRHETVLVWLPHNLPIAGTPAPVVCPRKSLCPVSVHAAMRSPACSAYLARRPHAGRPFHLARGPAYPPREARACVLDNTFGLDCRACACFLQLVTAFDLVMGTSPSKLDHASNYSTFDNAPSSSLHITPRTRALSPNQTCPCTFRKHLPCR